MNVAVLVSGGVDSSVALRLLKEQGYNVTAFYLKIWLEDELSFLGTCPWEEDLAYVQAVCAQAEVPLEVLSLQKEYWQEVVQYTIEQVKAGNTPNPDSMCNQRIKFGAFYTKINGSFDAIATGHYAQIVHNDGHALLYTAPDPIKDQTYFLSHVPQEQLMRALFPIGHLTKAEVRAQATAFGLPNQNRKDSQGICFLGKLKFPEFIKYHLGTKQGKLIEYETGKQLGTHNGFWYYTIGQRQGLGLAGGPWYVVAKDIHENNVYISKQYYSPDKQRNACIITQCNWIPHAPRMGQQVAVKMRHGPSYNTALVTALDAERFMLELSERDQGLACGQHAVLYDNGRCLGGGIITP